MVWPSFQASVCTTLACLDSPINVIPALPDRQTQGAAEEAPAVGSGSPARVTKGPWEIRVETEQVRASVAVGAL
jgi:hypothetical protein